MIKLIDNETFFNILLTNCEASHYSENITFLFKCYGLDTSFCKFYEIDSSSVLCIFEKESVIISDNGINDYEELAMFISDCKLINASVKCCKKLLPFLSEFEDVPVDFQVCKISDFNGDSINTSPDLNTVYDIIRSGFGEIDYSSWYTDTSHKIRHNLCKCFTYKDSATLTASFFDSGIFFSQVSTLIAERRKGYAKTLLHSVASLYKGKKIYLIAEHSKRPFYKASGFEISGTAGRLRKKS